MKLVSMALFSFLVGSAFALDAEIDEKAQETLRREARLRIKRCVPHWNVPGALPSLDCSELSEGEKKIHEALVAVQAELIQNRADWEKTHGKEYEGDYDPQSAQLKLKNLEVGTQREIEIYAAACSESKKQTPEGDPLYCLTAQQLREEIELPRDEMKCLNERFTQVYVGAETSRHEEIFGQLPEINTKDFQKEPTPACADLLAKDKATFKLTIAPGAEPKVEKPEAVSVTPPPEEKPAPEVKPVQEDADIAIDPDSCEWATDLPRRLVVTPTCQKGKSLGICSGYVVCNQKDNKDLKFVRLSSCSAQHCHPQGAVKCITDEGYSSEKPEGEVRLTPSKKVQDAAGGAKQ